MPHGGNIFMDKYLTPAELCERLSRKITTKTLANWRSMGKGLMGPDFVKLGGKILYPLSRVIAWERGHTYKSTRDYGRAEGSA
jgi:hypothetical protein